MRIGTWNLDGKWEDAHRQVLLDQDCHIWLLTEVSPDAKDVQPLPGYQCHLSVGTMVDKLKQQRWAGILCRDTMKMEPMLPDPHAASAAAIIDGRTYCSTVLPWGNCKKDEPHPWVGDTVEKMSKHSIDALMTTLKLPDTVWGGDWNQNLSGGWESVGSDDNRMLLNALIDSLKFQVPTSGLLHTIKKQRDKTKTHAIDHIALPWDWEVESIKRIAVPFSVSDHDAYVVEVEPR